MDNASQTIVDIQKNARESIRVSISEFKGYQLVDMRVFVEADDDEAKPTKKGLCVRVELIPQLIEALSLAAQYSKESRDG